MSENDQKQNSPDIIPTALVKEKRTLSLIWLIPLVALAIGVWLTIKAINEKGPTVTITFKSAPVKCRGDSQPFTGYEEISYR